MGLKFIDNEFNLIKNVLNKLLESQFISANDKAIIKSIPENITNILKMNYKTIFYFSEIEMLIHLSKLLQRLQKKTQNLVL
jgi:rRNA pseudouridine-1189 N-methylase Emg1 (Nep1/Mra1 family)